MSKTASHRTRAISYWSEIDKRSSTDKHPDRSRFSPFLQNLIAIMNFGGPQGAAEAPVRSRLRVVWLAKLMFFYAMSDPARSYSDEPIYMSATCHRG